MNKAPVLLISAALVGAALLVWFLPTREVTNYPSSGTDIIAFGDSLVAGTGAGEGEDFVAQLSNNIGRPIINLGVPGDTTESGLMRISEIDRYNPKVVIVLLGGNDYLRKVPQEQTFKNLSHIIEYVHSKGAIVLLLGVRGGLLRDNFAAQFETLSDTYHTAYVHDVLDELIGNREYMADQVHPNAKGYAHIAARVEKVLTRLLE